MRKITQKLLLSIFTVAFAVIALGTSTFAWFTLSNQATVSQFNLNVKGGSGFEIQVTEKGVAPVNGKWYTGTITTETINEIINQAYVTMDAVTVTADGTAFQDLGANTVLFNPNTGVIDLADQGHINQYLQFDIHIRPQQSGKIMLVDGTTLGTSNSTTWTSDRAFTLAADGVDVDVDDVCTFAVSSAARLMFKSGTEAAKIYEAPAATASKLGINVTAGNSLGQQTNANTGAAQYYNDKNDPDLTFGATYAVTDQLDAELNSELGDVVANTVKTFTCSVWLEGWDGECMNAIFRQQLNIALAFELVPTV